MRYGVSKTNNSGILESRIVSSPDHSDFIHSYLSTIGKSQLLTHSQECELAKRAKRGDEAAKSKLVESNFRLVVSIAKIHSCRGMPLDDLIQEGNIGLIRAAECYNPDRGCRFSTYAVAWIKQAVLRAIERYGRAIRLPCNVVQAILRLNRADARFQCEHGRNPTGEELAEIIGVSNGKLAKLIEASEALVSLDDGIKSDETLTLLDRQIEGSIHDPEVVALRNETNDIIQRLIGELNPQEKLIIERRFGFEDGVGETLEKIGRNLKITRERVRQVETRAVKKLRTAVTINRLDMYFKE